MSNTRIMIRGESSKCSGWDLGAAGCWFGDEPSVTILTNSTRQEHPGVGFSLCSDACATESFTGSDFISPCQITDVISDQVLTLSNCYQPNLASGGQDDTYCVLHEEPMSGTVEEKKSCGRYE